MHALQVALSDLIKLFIGPHEADSPVHPWGRIVLVLASLAAVFTVLALFMP